jgi:sulfane dehydrogenase subunit SoxC
MKRLEGGKHPADRTLGRGITRRQLLAAMLGAAGSVALSRVALGQTPTPPTDTTRIPGRPADEIGTPSVFEEARRLKAGQQTWFAPLDQFHGSITPSGLHFVVAHAGIPQIDPKTYKLLIHGMVERPMAFTLDDLKRFPSVSKIYFIECSGNSANAWFEPLPEDSVQNVHGLTSASEWTGVPLSALLREVGAKDRAMWMLAESQDAAVFARSIPADKAWKDILVAYGQNGEALRPEQGYPVRLIVPGWEGSINIKWLRRIELSDRPFMTRDETAKYTDTMPDGTALQFTFGMEVKSVITRPSGGYRIPAKGFWEITGIAWSGKGKIRRVEVSTDGGSTWGDAQLQEPVLAMAHTRFRYPWVWDGREAVLMSRATDDTGDAQPDLDALVRERGLDSLYHNHAIQAWRVDSDGSVFSTHEPFASAIAPLAPGAPGCRGCLVQKR